MPVTPEGARPPSMTVSEVANTLRVSRRTVQRYLDRGYFPRAWDLDRGVRIPTEDVEEFQAQRTRNRAT